MIAKRNKVSAKRSFCMVHQVTGEVLWAEEIYPEEAGRRNKRLEQDGFILRWQDAATTKKRRKK